MGIVHGDFATENVLVNPATFDVKLVDFDLASKEGSAILAGGNPDFITAEMASAVTKPRFKVESQFQTDLYALALCCFLVLGDSKKKFFASLSEASLDVQEKESMITLDKYPGSRFVV
jgi:serine/threonine protein kinase